MSRSASCDLNELTAMLLRVEEARMQELNEKEAGLRRVLAALDDDRKAALSLPYDALMPIRSIGGDIRWQAWIGRNRAELNRQLALCLAQKARRMDRLRRAHGKHEAAKSLLEKELSDAKAVTSGRQLQQLDALLLARSYRR